MVEFQKKLNEFQDKGISVIGISYDPVSVLKKFSDAHQISYPLLSDVKSEVIKKYGILNKEVESDSKNFGIPNPGIYIIDENLIFQRKQFEKSYAARPSAESILAVFYNKEIDVYRHNFSTSYLNGSIALSDTLAFPGQLLTLEVKFSLKDDFHMYVKPIPEGYTALTIDLEPSTNFILDPIKFPDSKRVTVESLDEIFNAISDDITLKTFIRVKRRSQLGSDNLVFEIKFQACNDKLCMPPESLRFQFPVTITRDLN